MSDNVAAMGKRDKRFDQYIAKSQDFAKPILSFLREVVHEGCPEAEETMKWSMPHFTYKGALFCGMAAFKEHATFGFWKGSMIVDKASNKSVEAMGQFGRITHCRDLPTKKTLLSYIKEAKRLEDEGVRKPSRPRTAEKKSLSVPRYFTAAVKKNKKALATFEAFPYSKKKDYVQWVTEAKTDETRARRLATAVEWMSEGKARHWKFERC